MHMTVFQMELELWPMLDKGLHGIEDDDIIEKITEKLVLVLVLFVQVRRLESL